MVGIGDCVKQMSSRYLFFVWTVQGVRHKHKIIRANSPTPALRGFDKKNMIES